MSNLAPILQALASLAWAAFAFTVLFSLRPAIIEALKRISKAELFGQKIELREELKELQASAATAEVEASAAQEQLSEPEQSEQSADKLDTVIAKILDQAKSAPKLALIALSAELEKQMRQALAVRGLLKDRPNVPGAVALRELQQHGFPPNMIGSMSQFQNIRNKVVHEASATDADALSALDSGITILRALDALPRERNVVYHPGVNIFSDEGATNIVANAKGIILRTTSPGGVTETFRIFPTTRTHFQKGKAVAWEWNLGKVWGKTWYRDPDSGAIKHAWDGAAEFIGRNLDDV